LTCLPVINIFLVLEVGESLGELGESLGELLDKILGKI
jgi:hypothetical protein